jgi:hypothetical protein
VCPLPAFLPLAPNVGDLLMTGKKAMEARGMATKGKSEPPTESKDRIARPSGSKINPLGLIVGIGASAGGLNAFKSFLSNMPMDSGMAAEARDFIALLPQTSRATADGNMPATYCSGPSIKTRNIRPWTHVPSCGALSRRVASYSHTYNSGRLARPVA